MPASDSFSFKASKDSSLDRFASWMKSKYSEPRQPGQRGASKIKDGMNPRTWIPAQIESIISTGKLPQQFSAEIDAFNEDQKYSIVSQEDVMRHAKRLSPQKFEEFQEMLNKARELAYRESIAKQE